MNTKCPVVYPRGILFLITERQVCSMQARKNKVWTTRAMAMTAMLGAVASVLMFLEFSLPFLIPSFVKMDFSELPALIASFAIGPVSGVVVCLIKNLVNLPFSSSGGVGELCNFLLGCAFVLPAGFLYRWKKNRAGALLGSVCGAVASAIFSFPLNMYITYPVYEKVFAPMPVIIGAYQKLLPAADTLWKCLLIFNLPFTLGKRLVVTLLAFLVYKPLSRFIKGAES